ncbi:MAG: MarR family transcriptional regulator [Mobiluncus sp.]|uniref:MarR family winged helix-turn-helix transcriptional regulator n=1 Tax=Mobiluncus sp. TaxID=47293 RepID=UPI00258DEBA0|nr:MarR family transcriptional regulator [Mobiluncus sp.]MCI6583836.1 MarR family transcriptional regulator [Mobiluncus sp.]
MTEKTSSSPDESNPRHSQRDELIYNLHRLVFVANNLVDRYSSAMGMRGKDGEAVLLVWQGELEGQPLTPSELADALHLTRAAATYQVDRLVNQGLLRRKTDPKDRRKSLLSLGENAAHVGHDFSKPLADSLDTVLAGKTDDEMNSFTELLGKLADSLNA